jgi:hypothetical protein
MPKLRLLETRNSENISQALRNYNQNFPATPPPAVLHYSKVERNEETSVPDAYLLRLQR